MSESGRDHPQVVFIRPQHRRSAESLPQSVPLPAESSFIQLRHPGYLTGHDLVLRLPALDYAPSASNIAATPRWGLHHATALHACSIIACNRRGYLSSTRLDTIPVIPPPTLPLDAVLTEPSYWFYPLGWTATDEPYPVCPDFENWEFPTDSIPEDWLAVSSGEYEGALPAPSQFSRVVNERDPACRISDYCEMTQVAHIVPKEERIWFVRNFMFEFNLNAALTQQYVTCDLSNCLRLRQDLHALFDTKAFTFVPKCNLPVVHFLTKGLDYCKEFHNRITGTLAVHPAFLYARFAWAILPLTANFSRRRDVRITVYNEDSATWEPTTAGDFARKVAADTTPTKRRRCARDDDADMDEAEQPADAEPQKRPCVVPAPASHAKLTDVFYRIVAANPTFAWGGLGWHPDLDRVQILREKALAQREPVLHRREVQRQMEMLERQGSLWEAEEKEDSGVSGWE